VVKSVVLVVDSRDRGRRSVASRAALWLQDHNVAVQMVTGSSVADTCDRARAAVMRGTDGLIAVGGDGTVGMLLSLIAGTATPLGIIPAGSGNDHARHYGIPLGSPEGAAKVIAGSSIRSVDLATVTTSEGSTRLFGSVMASGLDAMVNDRANRLPFRGGLRYKVAALIELVRLQPHHFRVCLSDGRIVEGDLLLIAVGNTRFYGGGIQVCPYAQPDDGLLDITVAHAVCRVRALTLLLKLIRGTHLDEPEVSIFRSEFVEIESKGATAYADGELIGDLPVRVSVWHNAASFFVPANLGST
jgi:diacylglycerol kinase (ATP)